jgi:hypothetical protein
MGARGERTEEQRKYKKQGCACKMSRDQTMGCTVWYNLAEPFVSSKILTRVGEILPVLDDTSWARMDGCLRAHGAYAYLSHTQPAAFLERSPSIPRQESNVSFQQRTSSAYGNQDGQVRRGSLKLGRRESNDMRVDASVVASGHEVPSFGERSSVGSDAGTHPSLWNGYDALPIFHRHACLSRVYEG